MEKMNNKPQGKESVSPSRQSKRRAVVSYANLNPELMAAFKEKYPRGYADYMNEVFKVDKPDGTSFYAISLEVPDAIYLVKVDVKIDDYEDLERGLFGGGSDDDGGDPDELPDDDSSSGFSEEEDSDD
jgi:hypothetical protein